MPGTAIELPNVDTKPVRATVNAIVHFFLGCQLRGFCRDEAKFSKSLAARRAEVEVAVALRAGNGVERVEAGESVIFHVSWQTLQCRFSGLYTHCEPDRSHDLCHRLNETR